MGARHWIGLAVLAAAVGVALWLGLREQPQNPDKVEPPQPKAQEADARSQSLEARIQEMAKDATSASEGLKQRLQELEERSASAESEREALVARASEAEALTVLVGTAKSREQ